MAQKEKNIAKVLVKEVKRKGRKEQHTTKAQVKQKERKEHKFMNIYE